MKGRNKLTINMATMIEAMEKWLNGDVLYDKHKVRVESVYQITEEGATAFEIKIEAKPVAEVGPKTTETPK